MNFDIELKGAGFVVDPTDPTIPIPPSGGAIIQSVGDGLYETKTVDGRVVTVDEFGNIVSID